MNRIIKSFGIIVFVGAVVVGATGAFFSATVSSTGNVFTAGSVSLELDGYEHVGTVPEEYFISPAPEGGPSSFSLADLKPLDTGTISGTLTNGANDAYVCARITGFSEESPFRDMLAFRTGTGPGGSFGDIVDEIPVDTWFAPLPPSQQPAAALPLDANQQVPVAIQYCFGQFIQGGGCELVPGLDYNPAQNQALAIDIEYYAVQQRNNEGFTCAGMNEEFEAGGVVVVDGESSDWGFVDETTTSFLSGTGVGEFVSGPGTTPLGSGSAELRVTNGGGVYLGADFFTGQSLHEIDTLTYATYRQSGDAPLAPSLQFNFSSDVTVPYVGWEGRLVYEPYHTDTVVTGSWQTWDTLNDAPAGNWYLTNGTLATNSGCTMASPCTWSQILAAFPDGGVNSSFGGVLFKAGGGWSSDFVGNVDNFVIGINGVETVFDFEN